MAKWFGRLQSSVFRSGVCKMWLEDEMMLLY